MGGARSQYRYGAVLSRGDLAAAQNSYNQDFFITKLNLPPSSPEDNNWLPVCFENASKSLTDPGSVAMIRRVWPGCMSLSIFLARRIGRGQLSPEASSSQSYSAIIKSSKYLAPIGSHRENGLILYATHF